MNNKVTSKEELLEASKGLVRSQGWSAVNIRSVAKVCCVSVGAIYNYFDGKATLVTATVESIWQEIFHRPKNQPAFQDIHTYTLWVYDCMAAGSKRYPDFFTLHSLGFVTGDKSEAKVRMQQTRQHILDGICAVLKRDSHIRPDAFNEAFSVEMFASILFSLMLSAMLRHDYDPTAILEMIRRTLY